MQFDLAPMEGLTGYIIRNAFHHYFDDIDTYYTPFIPAAKRMSKKIQADILPDNNEGIRLIPQVMSNNADEVIDLGHQLQAYGYDILNINLGCPSGTVVNKKRGSGLLAYPEELDHFLEELFSKTDMKISIKTRIGFYEDDEWEHILSIYKKYPLEELIIHPRIQRDLYRNAPRIEAFSLAMKELRVPLCYNGDIVDVESYLHVCDKVPDIKRVMIGRGMFRNPGLIAKLKETPYAAADYKNRLREFHDEIYNGFRSIFSGEKDALFRMKEVWSYLRYSFEDSDKYWKKIRKVQHHPDYVSLVNQLFAELTLQEL